MYNSVVLLGISLQILCSASYGVRTQARRPYYTPRDQTFDIDSNNKNSEFAFLRERMNDLDYMPITPYIPANAPKPHQSKDDFTKEKQLLSYYNKLGDYAELTHPGYDSLKDDRTRNVELMLLKTIEYVKNMDDGSKVDKRDGSSGAQICIWKVCPPSPWRRSKADN